MKIAFLYPGQGSQQAGMCKDFYLAFNEVKQIWDRVSEISKIDIYKMSANATEIKNSQNAQLLVFSSSLAVQAILEKSGVIPSMIAGHSLGEYTAITAYGALSFEEGLNLIIQRGKHMRESCQETKSGMLAIIGLNDETVKLMCSEVKNVSIANYNTLSQIVVSGDEKGIGEISSLAIKNKAQKVVKLQVDGAFHSKFMLTAQEKFVKNIEDTKFSDLRVPLVANTTADIIYKKEDVKNELIHHMISPVMWYSSINKMINDGVDTFIEVGYGKVLKGLILSIDRNKKVFSTSTVDELDYVIRGLAQ